MSPKAAKNAAEQKNRPLKTISVLYEDKSFVIFDKPAGLLVIPTPKKERKTLVDIVNRHFNQERSGKLYPCHRLDRDTSGIIVFAKGKKNQQKMMDVFKKKEIKKRYIAFVKGYLHKQFGEVRSRIKDFGQIKFQRNQKPKLAVTKYKVLKKKKGFSVLEVYPITGRTNQIRIHFSEMGHPLLGERKYAYGRDFDVKFRRTALHAEKLEFVHPESRKKIIISSDLPKDMKQFLMQNK